MLGEVAAGRIDLGLTGRGAVEDSARTARIETPYLQLVMQRSGTSSTSVGSAVLRLATLSSSVARSGSSRTTSSMRWRR